MIGIRGAIRVDGNERTEIFQGTQRLLREMMERNALQRSRVVSAFFTMTPDLNADFPAYAAREMGWSDVPMLGAQETAVPGALDRMIRILLHVDADGPARHVYLGEAASMRPDLADADAPVSGEPRLGAPPSGEGTLLVVGLGLIGGSAALAVRRAGVFARVIGYDTDPAALETARRAGAVDEESGTLEERLARADVVLLAIPVRAALGWLERRGPSLRPGTVVVDVASTKGEIVGRMDRLPEGVEAIGAHPMAGSELSGMGAARPDLFFGSTWALVRSRRAGPRAEKAARDIVRAVGGLAFDTDGARHDRIVAATSHLPYLVSTTLARLCADLPDREGVRALRGPGLRDMTRLAASEPGVMEEILLTNWPNVRDEVERFVGALLPLAERGGAPEPGELRSLFAEAARDRRDLFPPPGPAGPRLPPRQSGEQLPPPSTQNPAQ
ncbi:MAG: chorismate mutase [Gemmatimonadota bacterium]|nr:chorismate mutase [Gemmatimonadota bacterium]